MKRIIPAILMISLLISAGPLLGADVVLTMDGHEAVKCQDTWWDNGFNLWVVDPFGDDPCAGETCAFYGLSDRVILDDTRMVLNMTSSPAERVEVDIIETFGAGNTVASLVTATVTQDSASSQRSDFGLETLTLVAPEGASYLTVAACRGAVYEIRLFLAPLFTDGFETGDMSAWSSTNP